MATIVPGAQTEVCSQTGDENCDGQANGDDLDCQLCVPNTTQTCTTGLAGVCSTGTRTCTLVSGVWDFRGACVPNIVPGSQTEVYEQPSCSNTKDDDCDGKTDALDSDCFDCTPTAQEPCTTGFLGVCLNGTKTCASNGTWGSCVATVLPGSQPENCGNTLDDDCDGFTNYDDPDCKGPLTSSCSLNIHCASNYCVAGACCDSPCTGLCMQCNTGYCVDSPPSCLICLNTSSTTATSCKQIKDTCPGAASGTYWLKPTVAGAFSTYCDMSNQGGGWTLAAKVASTPSVWNYAAAYWTIVGNTFNENNFNLSAVEAKYKSFDRNGFTEIMLVDPINSKFTRYGIAATSLQHLFASSAQNTAVTVPFYDTQMFYWVGYDTAYAICTGHYTNYVTEIFFSKVNFHDVYAPVPGTEGNVRLGWWGTGSNAHVPAWTSDCGFGVGVTTSGYTTGTQHRGTTAHGGFTSIWVR